MRIFKLLYEDIDYPDPIWMRKCIILAESEEEAIAKVKERFKTQCAYVIESDVITLINQ